MDALFITFIRIRDDLCQTNYNNAKCLGVIRGVI